MAVKIRLSRFGKKHQPTYRIIAVDESKKRDGKYLENLGFYNPIVKPAVVKIDKERFEYWLSVGAKPTEAVRNLIKKGDRDEGKK